MDITLVSAALLLLINFVSAKIFIPILKGETASAAFSTLFRQISESDVRKCGRVYQNDPTDTAGFRSCIESLDYPFIFEKRIVKMSPTCFKKGGICCDFCSPFSDIIREVAKEIEGKCPGNDEVFDQATYDKIIKESTEVNRDPYPPNASKPSSKSFFGKLDKLHYFMAAVIILLIPTVALLVMKLRKTKKYDTEEF